MNIQLKANKELAMKLQHVRDCVATNADKGVIDIYLLEVIAELQEGLNKEDSLWLISLVKKILNQ